MKARISSTASKNALEVITMEKPEEIRNRLKGCGFEFGIKKNKYTHQLMFVATLIEDRSIKLQFPFSAIVTNKPEKAFKVLNNYEGYNDSYSHDVMRLAKSMKAHGNINVVDSLCNNLLHKYVSSNLHNLSQDTNRELTDKEIGYETEDFYYISEKKVRKYLTDDYGFNFNGGGSNDGKRFTNMCKELAVNNIIAGTDTSLIVYRSFGDPQLTSKDRRRGYLAFYVKEELEIKPYGDMWSSF